jgi:hypothetical protein
MRANFFVKLLPQKVLRYMAQYDIMVLCFNEFFEKVGILMFLRKANNRKTGRTYLSIVHGYWDTVSKQSR